VLAVTERRMEYRRNELDEVELNVGEAGQGPTVVLVHGSWDDHRVWDGVVQHLRPHWRLVVYDRRGHGGSSVPPGQGRISQDVLDLDGVIRAVDTGPVHLVGHSYGACVALLYAARHPQRLASVCLHEPPLFGVLAGLPEHAELARRTREAMAQAAVLIAAGEAAQGARLFAEEVALAGQSWESVMDASLRATWVANAGTWLDQSRDPERLALSPELLSASPLPVLLTSGDRSPAAFEPGVARLAAATPHAIRRTITGAGHFPQLTHPQALAHCLSEFLSLHSNPTTVPAP
jgi:pimeloyl-ACP methyl ester carboxylesterase